MYLNMIESDEEKKVFMQLANIVAISCFEGEETDREGDLVPLLSLDKKMETVDLEGWKPSLKEQEILKKYWNEMEGGDAGGIFGIRIGKYDIEQAIDELEPVLKQVRALDESARRKAIVDKLISECVDWDDVEDMAPRIRKIMMLELLALALVDNDYAELERHAMGLIAEQFSIDNEELEEMEEYIESYMAKFEEGLEIINA